MGVPGGPQALSSLSSRKGRGQGNGLTRNLTEGCGCRTEWHIFLSLGGFVESQDGGVRGGECERGPLTLPPARRGRVASSRTMPGFRRLTAVMAACVASLLRSVGASYVLHEEGTTSVVYTPEMCHPTYSATDTLTDYSAATPYGGRFQRGICDTAGNIYSARYAANDSSCSTPLFMTFLGRSPVPIPGNTTAGTQPYVLTCVQSNLVTFRYRRSPGLNCASTCGEQYDQIGICLPVCIHVRVVPSVLALH
jgi:hypothetical protein